MIAATPESLRARAERLAAAIGGSDIMVVACSCAIGGGSLPGETLPSFAVAIAFDSAAPLSGDGGQAWGAARPDSLARVLRHGMPPVVGRIAEDRLLLDVRTVLEEQEDALVEAVRNVMRES